MTKEYTKYIIQMRIATSDNDVWYDYTKDADTLEEAQEEIKFFREVHVKTHLFRITKRTYQTEDLVLEE